MKLPTCEEAQKNLKRARDDLAEYDDVIARAKGAPRDLDVENRATVKWEVGYWEHWVSLLCGETENAPSTESGLDIPTISIPGEAAKPSTRGAGGFPRVGIFVPIVVILLVAALVKVATGNATVASASSAPTTTSVAAASAVSTTTGAARPSATMDPARTPLTVHAQTATYASASSSCGYSVFFAWVVPGYNHEQVTIHLHETGGASNIDAVQKFAFAEKPVPTMPANGGYLALGGAYVADKQELVYVSGDSGANGGWTAEITAIGDHPISGELISTAPSRACG